MDETDEHMDASQMEQDHQSAVELWNDLQSQSDRVCSYFSPIAMATVSHALSSNYPVSKVELVPF